MFKRRRVIASVFVVLLLAAVGWGWFSGGSSAQVEVVGDLAAKDVKEIKGLVRGRIEAERDGVWKMFCDGEVSRILGRALGDDKHRLQRIVVQPSGEVWVYVVRPHVFEADYAYVLSHTNGWRIVGRTARGGI